MAVAQKKRKPKVWTPEAVRELRLRLGLTIEDVAGKIGVSPRTFYSWELPSQERSPSASAIILLNMLDEGSI